MTCTTDVIRVLVGRYPTIRAGGALAALALLQSASAAPEDGRWPHVPVPPQIATFEIAREMVLNGTAVRIQGFVSSAGAEALTASFRTSLGQPLMENRRGETIVLGRAEGLYYLTVQLDRAGSGTRGVIAVSKLTVDREVASSIPQERRLLSAMPPGSKLASHSSSIDGANQDDYVAIVNSHSLGINREYLQRMLRSDGLRLEREAGSEHGIRAGSPDAKTLWFNGSRGEAIAILFSDQRGKSVIVLNRVSHRSVE